MSDLYIKNFLNGISFSLKRIAKNTRGEFTHEDLSQEAYFFIEKFYCLHKRYPDLNSEEDKSWVLGRIYNHFVKWADHDFRQSVRMDSLKNDEGEFWGFDLPAAEFSNPLVQLLFKEQSDYLDVLLKQSYSEAKAYIVVFEKFDFDKGRLSSFLWITAATLDDRCERAITMVKQQRSLFDATEVIDESFNLVPGKQKVKVAGVLIFEQLAFRFLN